MTRKLSKSDRTHLVQCMQYLNLAEMRAFCRTHDLPLYIHVAQPGGGLRRSSDRDRKDVVLHRILEFALSGQRLGPTIYGERVVAKHPLPEQLSGRTRIGYGRYEKHNPRFVAVMLELTQGAYRNGMIARLVLRDF